MTWKTTWLIDFAMGYKWAIIIRNNSGELKTSSPWLPMNLKVFLRAHLGGKTWDVGNGSGSSPIQIHFADDFPSKKPSISGLSRVALFFGKPAVWCPHFTLFFVWWLDKFTSHMFVAQIPSLWHLRNSGTPSTPSSSPAWGSSETASVFPIKSRAR